MGQIFKNQSDYDNISPDELKQRIMQDGAPHASPMASPAPSPVDPPGMWDNLKQKLFGSRPDDTVNAMPSPGPSGNIQLDPEKAKLFRNGM